ncbi:hypothetical protein [Bradyrhizobium sp. WSM1743]|uniref:hypothetical protein n=1 Tax=Bradyrhizobium sp. WSM1743 TaxID=318996 RepID=UPI000484E498|nr:hypothetical protein [Bradyrhizobium sp. WSM1743]
MAYSFATTLDRESYLNRFAQPLPSTEAWLFGLALAAVAAGFFELMMRERAGIRQTRLLPSEASQPASLR